MHRDLKLDNILVHFPNIKGEGKGGSVSKSQLKKINCLEEEFIIKIADLGYAREIEYERKNREINMRTTNLNRQSVDLTNTEDSAMEIMKSLRDNPAAKKHF